MFVRSLTMKGRERLARDVFNTMATHGGFVRDVTDTTHDGLVHAVTDTYRCAQNGSSHGRVFSTFKRRFLSNKRRNQIC